MSVSQHRELSVERWRGYAFDQQILMMGNEMNRASAMLLRGDDERARGSYERVLALADLTVAVAVRRARRRELLRWRSIVAALYVSERPDAAEHRRAFRALLQFTPASARQIPLLAHVQTQDLTPPATGGRRS